MSRLLRLLLALSLPALATPGHALTIRCAGNVQQLAAALDEANASADATFIIRLRQGTYYAGQVQKTFAFYSDNPGQVIELSGGWSGSNDTCQTKSFDPSLTVLVGTATREALTLGVMVGASATSTAYVNDLTLNNPSYTGNDTACLSGVLTTAGEVRVERLHLERCVVQAGSGNGGGAARIHNTAGGLFTMRNVSVRDSEALANGGVQVNTQDGTSNLSQLSITTTQAYFPSSAASGLIVQNYGSGVTYVSNSVVWGNDPTPETADIYVSGSGIHLTRVHYGSIKGTPDSNTSPGTGDPGFVAIGDAHLRPDSLLIDSGISNPTGGVGTYDADGKPRVRGVAVDVGAFEFLPPSDLIFRNGFE